MTDPEETVKMFCDMHEENFVPGIEEDKIPTSEPEEKLPVHVIPDEEKSARLNENYMSSEFTYHKKGATTDTSAYDRVLNALKKLYTSYNKTISMHGTVIKGKCKVTGDTRVILIM